MKITLYPTAGGCHRPPQVMLTARQYIDAGRRVAVSSRDHVEHIDAGGPLAAAIQIGNWQDIAGLRPHLVILDNLWFVDPDGVWLFDARPDAPTEFLDPGEDQPRVSLSRFRRLIRELPGRGVEELILVSERYGISGAWQAELEDAAVEIRWDCAARLRWRTWRCSRGTGELMPEAPDQPGSMSAALHSGISHLLMALVAEFNDLQFGRQNPQCRVPHRNYEPLFLMLDSILHGQSADRVGRLCEEVRDQLALLSTLVEGYADPGQTGNYRAGGPAHRPARQNLH